MRHLASICVLAVAVSSAAAQPSTATLEPGGSLRFELTGGTEWLTSNERVSGLVIAIQGGVRAEISETNAALRFDTFWLHRSLDRRNQSGQPVNISHTVVGLLGATDVEFRLGPEAAIAPFAGFGFAPFASSTNGASSGGGTIWSLGMIIRVRKLIVRQNFIGLLGVSEAIPEFREYYPLTIGWRF